MSYHVGTKVTDSTATKTEKPGTITSDSLAAESLSSASGTFANNKATPSSQPSNSTTANNTDTSSATTLPPAKDAQARGNEEETSLSAEQAELDAGRPSNNSNHAGLNSQSDTKSTSSYLTQAATAHEHDKPHGKNITEDQGFEGTDASKNASFNGHVGDKDDPARRAIKEMQKRAVEVGGGAGGDDGVISNDGQFDILKDASA